MTTLSEASATHNKPLDVLRTLAALAVVAGHARALFFVNYSEVDRDPLTFAFYAATSLGHQAVVVFFVLSGFWVGGGYLRKVERGSDDFIGYFIDRVTRLYVVLIPALVLTAILDAVGRVIQPDSALYRGSQGINGMFPEAIRWDVWDFLGNMFFLQDIAVPPFGSNQALWSLSYEFWFYMAFPPLVWLTLPKRRFRALPVLVVTMALAFPVMPYFPVWLIGAAAAWGAPALRDRRWMPCFVAGAAGRWTCAALLVTIAAAASQANYPILLEDYVLALVTGLLVLLWGGTDSCRNRRSIEFLENFMSARAQESFSLYAIHLPILVFGAALSADFLPVPLRPSLLPLLGCGTLIGLTMLAAFWFAQLTEARTASVRGAVRRWAHHRKSVSQLVKDRQA